ncbi:MAG: hypothetical protein IKU19_08020, partial [Clostridia bacterium]|nr:hypothetical protein [Clostridia bacterium]
SALSDASGLIYGASDDSNYYIYALSMADLCTSARWGTSKKEASEVTKAVNKFKTDVEALDPSKPLFIAGHMPLYYNSKRADNGYALEWCNAINEIAANRDVVYFHGHNHKYDVDEEYYIEKGSNVSISTLSGDTCTSAKTTLNFTHMNVGYLEPTSSTSYSSTTRVRTALAAVIYSDSIDLIVYDAGGVYDGGIMVDGIDCDTAGKYAQNHSVERDHAGSSDNEQPDGSVETLDDVNGTGVTVTAPGITEVRVTDVITTAPEGTDYTAYLTYDINVDDFAEGSIAEVTVPVNNSFDLDLPVMVLYNGEVIAVTFIVNNTVTFTTDHFSLYNIVQPEWVEIPGGTKTIYRLASSLTPDSKYVIVSTDAAGNANALNLKKNNYSYSVESTPVTVVKENNDTYIETVAASAQWTYTSNTLQNVSYTDRYLCGNGSLSAVTNLNSNYTTWSFDNESYGLRAKKSSTSSSSYYLRYSNSAFTVNNSNNSTNRVYLYVEDSITTPTQYVALTGKVTWNILPDTYASAADLEAAIRYAIQVWVKDSADGDGVKVDDFELAADVDSSEVDPSEEGEYTYTVKYNGTPLNNKITVTIKDRTATSIAVKPENIVVDLGSPSSAALGFI